MSTDVADLDPALLSRLKSRRGIISLAVPQRLVGLLNWLEARRSLVTFLASRRATGSREIAAVPVVHARPLATEASATAAHAPMAEAAAESVRPLVRAVADPSAVSGARLAPHPAQESGAGSSPRGITHTLPPLRESGPERARAEHLTKLVSKGQQAIAVAASAIAQARTLDPNPGSVAPLGGSGFVATAGEETVDPNASPWVVLPAARKRTARPVVPAQALRPSLDATPNTPVDESQPHATRPGAPALVSRGEQRPETRAQRGAGILQQISHRVAETTSPLGSIGAGSDLVPEYARARYAESSGLPAQSAEPHPVAMSSAPGSVALPSAPGSVATAPSLGHASLDIDALVEKVQRKIVRRLAVKNERRGGLR